MTLDRNTFVFIVGAVAAGIVVAVIGLAAVFSVVKVSRLRKEEVRQEAHQRLVEEMLRPSTPLMTLPSLSESQAAYLAAHGHPALSYLDATAWHREQHQKEFYETNGEVFANHRRYMDDLRVKAGYRVGDPKALWRSHN
jgi:hypothetical protein